MNHKWTLLCADLGVIVCFSDPLGFDSEDELVNYYESLNDTYQDTYAVVFEGMPAEGDPDNFRYKIRLSDPKVQTSRLFPEFETNGPGFSGTVCECWRMYVFVF
jgi:hypothetical protein